MSPTCEGLVVEQLFPKGRHCLVERLNEGGEVDDLKVLPALQDARGGVVDGP